MNGLNRIFLMGHLGGNPNTYESVNGNRYTCLNIATHRSAKNDQGGWEQRTDWHHVNVWGPQGETCAERLIKGQPVMVEGYLAQYQRELVSGEKQYKTAINALKVEFLPRGNSTPEASVEPQT